ncbi:hypothetical protein HPG69_016222 [Diceros bicornis minor]|uniref:Uncharacterized protein n=1 Tax=Diceros bicornis minor TaxID=77932 RepID=A0A7J7FHM1_DICBM|nr:hypothetical protein HPG69_016222 [Diceros bicornis minor]
MSFRNQSTCCIYKNASEIKTTEENGVTFGEGTNLIQRILDGEIHAGFYLIQNSIGCDIPQRLELFKTGHKIKVDEERENFLETKIATLDQDRPLSLGSFVIPAFLHSSSEGFLLKMESLLPKQTKTKETAKDAA